MVAQVAGAVLSQGTKIAAKKAVKTATKKTAKVVTAKAAKTAAKKVANVTAKKAVKTATKKTAKTIAKKATKTVAKQGVKNMSNHTINNSVSGVIKNSVPTLVRFTSNPGAAKRFLSTKAGKTAAFNFAIDVLSTDEAKHTIDTIISKASDKLKSKKTTNVVEQQPVQNPAPQAQNLSAKDIKQIAEDMKKTIAEMQEIINIWEANQMQHGHQRSA